LMVSVVSEPSTPKREGLLGEAGRVMKSTSGHEIEAPILHITQASFLRTADTRRPIVLKRPLRAPRA